MAQSPVESSRTNAMEIVKARRAQVLHVDDDASFLKTAKAILEMDGVLQVDAVSSVEEALEMMQREKYDAIVCDYQMPKKDGLQFLKELRESGNSIQFVIFTGKGREEIAIRALNLGADGYFSKAGHPETVYGELVHGIRLAVERTRVSGALRESEIKSRTLLENLPQKIFFKDRNSVYISCNENYARDLKIEADEIKGKTDFDFYPKELAEKYRADDARIMKSGKTEDMDEEYVQNGQRAFVHMVKTPVKDEKRNVVGILGIFWDITERKKAEKDLRESEEKFRDLFESAFDMMALLDTTGRILAVNKKAVELYGGSKKELIGKHFARICHGIISPTDIQRVAKAFAEGLANKRPRINIILKNKKGHKRSLECASSLLKRDDKVTGLFVIGRDTSERKKAEQSLRESEEKYRSFVQNLQGIAYRGDTNFNADFFHGPVKEITGYTEEELLKRKTRWDRLIHEEDSARILNHVKEAISNKDKSGISEYRIVRKDGTVKWIRQMFNNLFDDSGEVTGSQGILYDITEEKKKEEMLHATEQRYRSYIEVSGHLGWTTNPDGEVEEDIPTWRKFTGQSYKEVKGWGWTKALHQDDLEHAKQTWKEAIAGKSAYDVEYRVRRHDGVYRHFLARGVPLFNEDGSVREWVGTCIDITERKKAETELHSERKRLLQVLETLPQMVCLLTPDHHVAFANRSFRETFGESNGRHCYEYCFGKPKPCDFCQTYEVLKTGKPHHWVVAGPGGAILEAYDFPFADADGSPMILEMDVDITKQKQAEEARLAINEKLRVVGGLTRHDVRNKLGVVTGNAYLARKKLLDKGEVLDYEVLDYLEQIETSAEEIVRILKFAKNYEMLGVEELVYVDLEKAVNDAVSLFSGLKDIEVMNNCHGLTVLADSLLRTLFYNLVDNSLKHGERVSRINVHYEETEDGLRLFYEDDGGGIPQAVKPKIFDEGYTTGKGSGHALFLSKKMIEVYGWTIGETGEPGRGVKFVITMPKTNPNGKENYHTN